MEQIDGSDINDTAQKRGRGRPRKNQVVSSIDPKKKNKQQVDIRLLFPFEEDKSNDDIILRLPITSKDVDKFKSKQQNNIFEKNDSKISSSSNGNDTNKFTIGDINSDDESVSDDYQLTNTNKELALKVKDQEKLIKKLENEIEQLKSKHHDAFTGLNDARVSRMKTNFIYIDETTGKQLITDTTSVACWWCTYNFDNAPCFIPERFDDNKYYVFGCFCSYNCAAAYNLNMSDYKTGNRHSLLKKIYNTINDSHEEIPLAPPREVFEKFGGSVKWNDYRKNCVKCIKEYRFIMPPMVSIVPLVEESTKNNAGGNIKLPNMNDDLILRRSKPLPHSKATLVETMGLARKPSK